MFSSLGGPAVALRSRAIPLLIFGGTAGEPFELDHLEPHANPPGDAINVRLVAAGRPLMFDPTSERCTPA